ncbi:MAG: hypothetical protein LBL23_06115 [Coriobacteriales bacterium]|nr:hypothetical protein [Coriobacteriales bacterium]
MFLKSKSIWVVIALAVAIAAGGVFVVTQGMGASTTFAQSGYVLADKAENEDGGYTSVQVPFASGAIYQANRNNDKLTLTNSTDDSKTTVDSYGFVHYEDGSVAALKPGVLLDLGTLQPQDMAAYNINPDTSVTNNGSSFGLEHMGENVPLDSVLWKLSENKMMIMGQDLSLQLSEGDPYTFDGYVEVSYVDNGVIQVSDAENTLLTISPVAQLTVNNGPVIDLYNRVAANDQAQLPLNNLLVGNSDNVDITPVEQEALQAVTIPTFTVIQGVDGVGGDPGRGGDGGTSGENGSSGSEGASGSSGDGTDYDDPEDPGENQVRIEQFIKPIFELPTFQWDSNSFEAGIIIKDDEGVLYPDADGHSQVTVRVIDVLTGANVYPTPITNANNDDLGSADAPWLFSSDQAEIALEPNRTYKFIVSAPYVVTSSGADEIYWADFITKTFTTDGLGLTFSKSEVTDGSLKVNLRMEEFSKAYGAKIRLYDAAGYAAKQADPNSQVALYIDQVVLEKDTPYDDGAGENPTFGPGDNFYTFSSGLDKDTKYYVIVEDVIMLGNGGFTYTAENYHMQVESATLKDLSVLNTEVGAPKVFANKSSMSISVQPGSIPDVIEPTSIVSYRYLFYELDSYSVPFVVTDPTRGPVLTLTSQTAGAVLANVAPSGAAASPGMLRWGQSYRVRMIIEVFDNEKLVEYESVQPSVAPDTSNNFHGYSGYSESVGLAGSSFPAVNYLPNPDYASSHPEYDKVVGTLGIDPSGSTIVATTTQPIEIVMRSANSPQSITVPITSLPADSNDIGGFVGVQTKKSFTLPINADGLQANTAYSCVVWAYCDLGGNTGSSATFEKVSIGTMSISTAVAQVTSLHLKSLDSGGANAFSVGLWLDDYAGASFEYEASKMLYVKLGLYEGFLDIDEVTGKPNRKPDKTVDLTVASGNDPAAEVSTLASYLYTPGSSTTVPGSTDTKWVEITSASPRPSDTGQAGTGFLKITNNTFGIDSSIAAPAYTLMVESIQDYTAERSDRTNFINSFRMVNSEVGMRQAITSEKDAGYPNNGIDILAGQTAPKPPVNGDGFQTSNIKESTRNTFLPTQKNDDTTAITNPGNVRVDQGYAPETDVGIVARATFSPAAMVDSFTYTLWRTKTASAGSPYNNALIYDEEDLDSTPTHVNELLDANREKVISVKLEPYTVGGDVRVPTLNIGFGKGTDVLPAGNAGGLPDNNNKEVYQIYLAGSDTLNNNMGAPRPTTGGLGEMASATLGSDGQAWNDEADGRGYNYYLTYTADLSGRLGGGGTYTWPTDYISEVNGVSVNWTNYQVTSKRVSASRQAPIFQLIPWTSTNDTESWRYRLTLLDPGIFVDGSTGASLSTNQLTLREGESASGDPIHAISVTSTGPSGSWSPMVFGQLPSYPLPINAKYYVSYNQKLWVYGGVDSINNMVLMNRYHYGITAAATVNTDAGIGLSDLDPADPNAVTFFTNASNNTVNIVWPKIWKNSGNQALFESIAGVEIKVWCADRNSSGAASFASYDEAQSGEGFTWSKIVNMGTGAADPMNASNTYATASITLADLKTAGFLPGDATKIETRLIFDTGTIGYGNYGDDVLGGELDTVPVANTNMFALQSQGADLKASRQYQLPGATAGAFAASDGSAAGGIYASRAGLTTTSQKVDAGASAIFDSTRKRFSYASATTNSFKGSIALSFDSLVGQAGARIDGTAQYITPKLLGYSATQTNDFAMTAMVPQVSQYSADPAPSSASISFYLEGAGAPDPLKEVDGPGTGYGYYQIKVFKVEGTIDTDLSTLNAGGLAYYISGYDNEKGLKVAGANGNGTQSFVIQHLDTGTRYKFQVFGDFTKLVPGALQGPANVLDSTYPQYYFYDVVKKSPGREYDFITVSGVTIGGAANDFYADLQINSYADKRVRLHYSLSSTRGFDIYYTITDTTLGYTGNTRTIKSPASPTYSPIMNDLIPIGQAVGDVDGAEAEALGNYNDFLIPGHSYSITITAYTGGYGVGSLGSQSASFTLRELREPTFILTASPYWDPDKPVNYQSIIGYTAAISDPDRVIADAEAYLKAWQTDTNGTALVVQDTLVIKSSSEVLTAEAAGGSIYVGSEYTAALYADTNLKNEFPYTSEIAAAWPSNNTVLDNYQQRTVNVYAVSENDVLAGTVGVVSDANDYITLTFDNSVNLSSETAPRLQYTIIPVSGAGAGYPLTTVAFDPQAPAGLTGYQTFTLPDSSNINPIKLSEKGKYFIQYSIILKDGITSINGTLTYVKS